MTAQLSDPNAFQKLTNQIVASNLSAAYCTLIASGIDQTEANKIVTETYLNMWTKLDDNTLALLRNK